MTCFVCYYALHLLQHQYYSSVGLIMRCTLILPPAIVTSYPCLLCFFTVIIKFGSTNLATILISCDNYVCNCVICLVNIFSFFWCFFIALLALFLNQLSFSLLSCLAVTSVCFFWSSFCIPLQIFLQHHLKSRLLHKSVALLYICHLSLVCLFSAGVIW